MKIFLSWSGSASKLVAESLKEWLPYIMQSLEPWVSSSDIDAGSRWSSEVGKQLETTDFGILCLTQENIDAPWILFEAGTLAKSLESSHLCPLLVGLSPSELKGPLAQFQALKNDKKGIWKLISTIYQSSVDKNISENQLATIFERFWPDLEKKFAGIDFGSSKERVVRTERSMLEEILSDIRLVKREMSLSEKSFISNEYENQGDDQNSIKLIIDLSVISNKKQKVYLVDKKESFQGFLDILWTEVVSKTFNAYTYGKEWTLVNKTNGKLIIKDGEYDSRTIEELGFQKKQILQIKAL